MLICFSYQKEFHGALFWDEEVAFVYVYEKPVDTEALKLQPEELEGVLWQDYEEVAEAVAQRNPAYCVPRGRLLPVGKYPKYGKLISAES